MVQLKTVEDQLKEIGSHFRFFGRPEIRELAKVLMPGERIASATNGFYEGGFAMLCVTDQRLLLIDKKPMYLTIEDVRFDMIAEIDFNHRLLNATARVFSTNKALTFTSWNHERLRKLIEYLQHRVMQIRMQHMHVGSPMQTQFLPHEQQPQLPPPRQQANDRRYIPAQAPHIVPSLAYLAMQDGEAAKTTAMPAQGLPTPHVTNPFTKVPLLSRRRKFPSFY